MPIAIPTFALLGLMASFVIYLTWLIFTGDPVPRWMFYHLPILALCLFIGFVRLAIFVHHDLKH